MENSVLIVDDQVELTQLLGEYFRIKKGYHVLIATDGRAAMDLIREHKPKLVLLDMKLPSVNGIEILKALRKDYPDSRVIVMTAYDNEYKKKIDLIGYDAFFVKPMPFEELKDAVDALLAGKSAGRPKAGSAGEDAAAEIPVSAQARKLLLPKARIMVVEIKSEVAALLKDYLESIREQGIFTVEAVDSGYVSFAKVRDFRPDIVLYDIVEIGDFSEFASRLMSLPNPPKEIILFGDPQFKWEEAESLIKRGAAYVPTPLAPRDEKLAGYNEFNFPAKEAIDKLVNAIRESCFKHGLAVKEAGGRDGG